MKKALCVGINDYPGTINDLNGCVNDAEDWAALLSTEFAFTQVNTLLNENATKENILNELTLLVDGAEDGDVIVFTYSGHGTQYVDEDGDEEDYYDEALYVYDTAIIDDELREILDKLNPGATAYLIIDSCFSGTVTRLLINNTELKPRFIQNLRAIGRLPRKRFLEEEMKELLLTGSSDSEYSYDAYINGRYNGAMSYYALRRLEENTEATWEDFYSRLRLDLPSSTFPQTPQLEGKEELKQRKIFKEKQIDLPIEVPVGIDKELFYKIIILVLIIFGVVYLVFK